MKQIGYQVQPGNRISEVQLYDDDDLLVMEAAFTPQAGNRFRFAGVPVVAQAPFQRWPVATWCSPTVHRTLVDSAPVTAAAQDPAPYDLAVVGAGIVGLAHAYHAVSAGMRVVVVDRAADILGASVRNFGHLCFTAQGGRAYEYGQVASTVWERVAVDAGLWLGTAGTTVLARTAAELKVLQHFCAARGSDEAVLLDAAAALARVPAAPRATGGAWFPRDRQVDPRRAAGAIRDLLARRGVEFRWRTAAIGVRAGELATSRGDISARRIVVAVNHDIDELFPAVAEAAQVRRCALHMAVIGPASGGTIAGPVLSGWSLLRYAGFGGAPALAAVRAELAEAHPLGAELDLNLMCTQRPDGGVIVGDTHLRGVGVEPFQSEDGFDLVVEGIRDLIGRADLPVLERWQGIYATAPQDYLVHTPDPGVRVVAVTTGIGMTTAFGLAADVLTTLDHE